MTNSAAWPTKLVVYAFHPPSARVLASNCRFTLLVAPVS